MEDEEEKLVVDEISEWLGELKDVVAMNQEGNDLNFIFHMSREFRVICNGRLI